jgi:hypothetical protein
MTRQEDSFTLTDIIKGLDAAASYSVPHFVFEPEK